MSGRVCVYGLWHLGCVTAACLAEQGLDVVGLDADEQRVADLTGGRPPVAEPGLAELIGAGLSSGRLAFTTDARTALAAAETLWVTFDTPVDDADIADVAWVRGQLDLVREWVQPYTLVVTSSQVPVGFSDSLRTDWTRDDPTLRFVSAPENLRLGQALESFRSPTRVVVGATSDVDRMRVQSLWGPLHDRILWMSLASAEMTKHALNGFLAMSVAYTNEVARICERVSADAADVERGLRSEPRIGSRAYVKAGPAIAGGTLARDVRYLVDMGDQHGVATPLLRGVQDSNRIHMEWTRERLRDLLGDLAEPRVALLGLTYKVGTDTLRRSSALELAQWLAQLGVTVAAYDPVVHELPDQIPSLILTSATEDALMGADVVVVGTPWPEFATVDGDQLARTMRHPQVIDQAGFLAHLASDPRVRYVGVGRQPAVSDT